MSTRKRTILWGTIVFLAELPNTVKNDSCHRCNFSPAGRHSAACSEKRTGIAEGLRKLDEVGGGDDNHAPSEQSAAGIKAGTVRLSSALQQNH